MHLRITRSTPRTLGTLAVLIATTVFPVMVRAATICTAADIYADETDANCPDPPSLATCNIVKNHNLLGSTSNCTLNFGNRDVVFNNNILSLRSGKITVIAKSVSINGSAYFDGRGNNSAGSTTNGSDVTIQATDGNITLAASNSRIHVGANAQSGRIVLNASGAVSITGQVKSEALLAAGFAGSIDITAGTTITAASASTVDVTGRAYNPAVLPIPVVPPKLKLTATGNISLATNTGVALDGGGPPIEGLVASTAGDFLTPNTNMTIDVGANSATIDCNNFTMTAGVTLDARGNNAAPADIGSAVTINALGSVSVPLVSGSTARILAGGNLLGGRVVITAGGSVAIGGLINIDGLATGADAGTLNIEAGTSITTTTGSTLSGTGQSGRVGGEITLAAGTDISLATAVNLTGGDGGALEMTAGGSVTMAGYTAEGNGTGSVQDLGSGGILDIDAATNVTMNAAISARGTHDGCGGCVTAYANFGNILVKNNITVDSYLPYEGGAGGGITLVAAGTVTTETAATLSAYGNGVYGCGGSICIDGNLGITLNGETTASGGSGGFIDIFSDSSIAIAKPLRAQADAYGSPGGELNVTAGVDGQGNLTVSALIIVQGGSCNVEEGCGTGGSANLEGCTVNLTAASSIDARAPDGAGDVRITAHEGLTVAGPIDARKTGTFGSDGSITFDYRSGVVPSVTGVMQPAAVHITHPTCVGPLDPAECLTRCPTCGNGTIEYPETCDSGVQPALSCVPLGGDLTCSRFCRQESCDDNNVCTDESCDPVYGCRNLPAAFCPTATPTFTHTGPSVTPTPTRTPTSTRTGTRTRTPTITTTPTISGTPTITGTPTLTRTITNTPTVTPTPTMTPPVLRVHTRIAARPGGRMCIPTQLLNAGSPLSTTNDIGDVSSLPITFQSVDINPNIGPMTMVDKDVSRESNGAYETYEVAGTNMVGIPNGDLYTAQYLVSAQATPGLYSISEPIPGATIRISTCTGDCNGNNEVSIGEVQQCVNKFLGAALCTFNASSTNCTIADANNNGEVSIGEVQQCVSRFLGGCP